MNGGIAMKLHRVDEHTVAFHCPGCQCAHQVRVSGREQPVWNWNGNTGLPTFAPSVRVRSDNNCCHSFVVAGRIQFLTDSTHRLAGQTVAIPDWEDC
jgi:hypothetical protein